MLDAELIQMITQTMVPLATDSDALALDAVHEVGPGGHFFGAAHTLARYETAFHAPMLSDWRNFESWQEAGAPTTIEHAHQAAMALLEVYEPPPFDIVHKDAVADYVARRTAEGGVLG